MNCYQSTERVMCDISKEDPWKIVWGMVRTDKRGQMQRWIWGCGLIIHLAMRPLTRHIKWKGNRKRRTSVYQTELDYLVYSITSQGHIDNTERCCRNHNIIGNSTRSWSCRQCVFLCVLVQCMQACSHVSFSCSHCQSCLSFTALTIRFDFCVVQSSSPSNETPSDWTESYIRHAKPKSSVVTELRQNIVMQHYLYISLVYYQSDNEKKLIVHRSD